MYVYVLRLRARRLMDIKIAQYAKNLYKQTNGIKTMFAVIKTGGKQYKVQKDDKIFVEKIEGQDGSVIKLDQVLMIADEKKSAVGAPVLEGAIVEAKIIRQDRGPKITIFKKKRRQNYRRKKGHRQDLTYIQITEIKAAA